MDMDKQPFHCKEKKFTSWHLWFFRVFDQLMCSEPEQDSHRLMDIINDCISAGIIEFFVLSEVFEERSCFQFVKGLKNNI